jgi:hypothetical protein
MFEPESEPLLSDAERERIYRRAPAGAVLIAGISTFIVMAIWVLFYVFVFVPRGMLR